jgi:hypothetical protein
MYLNDESIKILRTVLMFFNEETMKIIESIVVSEEPELSAITSCKRINMYINLMELLDPTLSESKTIDEFIRKSGYDENFIILFKAKIEEEKLRRKKINNKFDML